MDVAQQRHQRSFSVPFFVLLAGIIGIAWQSMSLLAGASAAYAAADKALAAPVGYTVMLPATEVKLHILPVSTFSSGSLWSLVSKEAPLASSARPPQLAEIAALHGDADMPMKADRRVIQPLDQLIAAAEKDGVYVMVSSAYRSIDDQRLIQKQLNAELGEDAASKIVAPPGTSEHHTGLAVDFSTASTDCEEDSDLCALGAEDAAWLRDNAYRYGFILRYDKDIEDETGYSYEPWHYRYVGIPLARALTESGLSFEAALAYLRPGMPKN